MTDAERMNRPVHPLLWTLAGLMVAIEAVFHAASAGWVSPVLSRWHGYVVFAFYDPEFEAALAGAGVSAHLVWSTITHAFLHGGWMHLLMNAAALLGLGHLLVRLAGVRAFVAVFAVSSVAGALAFALISNFPGPMVGASGAIFGLLGALTAWQERGLRRAGRDRTEIWQRILGLVVLNAALDLALGGMVAWEAHLGGFVGGWLMAYAFPQDGSPVRIRRRVSPG